MKIALNLMGQKLVKPAVMITHIGGLNAVADTIINLPQILGGKKLIYTNIKLDLTAIEDFKNLQDKNPLFKELYHVTKVPLIFLFPLWSCNLRHLTANGH